MPSNAPDATKDVWLYYGLACAITWTSAIPTATAWIRHEAPGPGAIAAAGLSALGPLIAAFVIALARRDLRGVFGRWRTPWMWPLLALMIPIGMRVLAAALTALFGAELTQWVYPPSAPERIAALFVLPLGEEFGWRGFAYPRLEARFGAVRGSLVLGLLWGFWHLAYGITPDANGFDTFTFLEGMLELPLYAILGTWFFEKSGRSMAVALAFHTSAHLDHIELAPRTEIAFRLFHYALVAAVALVAARKLSRRSELASGRVLLGPPTT